MDTGPTPTVSPAPRPAAGTASTALHVAHP